MTPARSVYVPQGKVEVCASGGTYFTTVLGSCVAACAWDEQGGMGGMNHLLLPPREGADSYGVHLMELLINALLRKGAVKGRLRVKLFGGARMIDGLSDVGSANAAFARAFFEHEGIPVISESLGGTKARRVQFWPASGRARQRFVNRAEAEPAVRTPPPPLPAGGEIELF